MADTKVTAFPPSAGLTLTDIFPVVDDPGGTPVTQRATFAQLQTLLGNSGDFVLKAGDTMTGALVHPVGAVGTPSITFTGDLDTGVYHPAANTVGLSAGGTLVLSAITTGVDVVGTVNVSSNLNVISGTTALANNVAIFGPGNTESFDISLFTITGSVPAPDPNDPPIPRTSFTFDTTSAEIASAVFNGVTFKVQTSAEAAPPSVSVFEVSAVDGTPGKVGFFGAAPVTQQIAPGISSLFTALANYGLLTSSSPWGEKIYFPDGTENAPGLAFVDDDNTGFYRPAADTLGVSAGGVRTLSVLTTGLNLNNVTAPGADPTTSSQQWAASGEWQYRSSTASEGAGQTNRVHNRSAQVYGAGTDYTLTVSNARVDFGTTDAEITLPTAGTYLLMAQLYVNGAVASVSDACSFVMRNATDSTYVGSGGVGTLFSASLLTVTLVEVVTVNASKLIQIFAANTTSARGMIVSAGTHIGYVRLY